MPPGLYFSSRAHIPQQDLLICEAIFITFDIYAGVSVSHNPVLIENMQYFKITGTKTKITAAEISSKGLSNFYVCFPNNSYFC